MRSSRYYLQEKAAVAGLASRRGTSRRVWRLENSIWKPRPGTCDSKDFYDTPKVVRAMFECDWRQAVAAGAARFIEKNDECGHGRRSHDISARTLQRAAHASCSPLNALDPRLGSGDEVEEVNDGSGGGGAATSSAAVAPPAMPAAAPSEADPAVGGAGKVETSCEAGTEASGGAAAGAKAAGGGGGAVPRASHEGEGSITIVGEVAQVMAVLCASAGLDPLNSAAVICRRLTYLA